MMLASISAPARARITLVIAVLVIGVAVYAVAANQQATADRAYNEVNAAERILISMLNQESGLRGYALTRRENFLNPYRAGRRDFDEAVGDALELSEGEQQETVQAQVSIAREWQRLADDEVRILRADREEPLDPELAVARKSVFDRFRAQNDRFQRETAAARDRDMGRAALTALAAVLGLGLLFGGVGSVLINRSVASARLRAQRARRYRESQGEFIETMQIMRDEDEAHGLVKEHLQRTLPGSEVTVLNRNNSDNRLMATTELAADSPVAESLRDANPESCLAIRLARPHERGGDKQPLLTCKVCGKVESDVTCVPSLVGGEVIGSVLVEHAAPLDEGDRLRVDESVGQAAPMLANLRTLAIAETRAATDALTGLPNARSCDDNLRRMLAHAGRSVTPLSAVLFDLDHFKEINDRFGHGAGDDVLAAVGETLRATLRESDFSGRYGGEEFLMLLPDTDRDGALNAAEKVRLAIAQIEIAHVTRAITASMGVATFPGDTVDGQQLLRMADRALYEAKGAGRNRVRAARPGTAADEPTAEPVGSPERGATP